MFSFLSLFSLFGFVSVRFLGLENLYGTLNATFFKSAGLFFLFKWLVEICRGVGVWSTGNAWEIVKQLTEFTWIFPVPLPLRPPSSSPNLRG